MTIRSVMKNIATDIAEQACDLLGCCKKCGAVEEVQRVIASQPPPTLKYKFVLYFPVGSITMTHEEFIASGCKITVEDTNKHGINVVQMISPHSYMNMTKEGKKFYFHYEDGLRPRRLKNAFCI